MIRCQRPALFGLLGVIFVRHLLLTFDEVPFKCGNGMHTTLGMVVLTEIKW